MTTRREFIQSSLASSALISMSGAVPSFLMRASAAEVRNRQERILVVVQLTGGNDGLNTLVPFGDDAYYQNRFTLAIGPQQVHKVDDHVGLNPALEGLSELLQENSLAILQGVGYPNPNRSHFESMDLWHTAHRQTEPVRTGWLGRILEDRKMPDELPAIHFGGERQPLALASDARPAVSIRSLDNFHLNAARDRAVRSQLDKLIRSRRPNHDQLLGFIQDSAEVALATSLRLEQVRGLNRAGVEYPPTPLARKLRAVAGLIGADLPTRIYYVTLDGFDTHSNQAEAHSGLLSQLDGALSAFMEDLTRQGQDERVAVVTFSEFGRRVRENASRGTDHGTAAPMFVLGRQVQAGLIGQHPSLTDLDQGDLKFGIDYRAVYAELLERWLGIDSRQVLGRRFEPLSIFG